MMRLLATAALLLAATLPVRAQAQTLDGPFDFDQIVAFGDSLSDPGNAFIFLQRSAVRPFEPTPSAPYLIGRFRFSNGPTWIERLARSLDLPRSGRPAFARPGDYTNYAVGGSRARPTTPLTLGIQVGAFLKDVDGDAPSDALYALWIGSNDLRDAFDALEGGAEGESERIVQAALLGTRGAIVGLWLAGAESFLILNLPNLAVTPSVRALGPDARVVAEDLSRAYNADLEDLLLELEGQLGIEIVRFDVFTLLDRAAADPAAFGLSNGTESCITPGVIRGAICPEPDQFLFWDFIHPTTAAHRQIAERVRPAITEPALSQ